MVGRMLNYIDVPNILMEQIKSIKQLCEEATVYERIGPVEFVEEILASGYSNAMTEYVKEKYLCLDPFKGKCSKYMRRWYKKQ